MASAANISGKGAQVSVESLTNPKRDGWLTKQGGSVKSWKRRWFVLKGGNLYYFKTKRDVVTTGVIALDVDSSATETALTKKKNAFEIKTKPRTFVITADSAEIKQVWINSINEAVTELRGKGGGATSGAAASPASAQGTSTVQSGAATTTPPGSTPGAGAASQVGVSPTLGSASAPQGNGMPMQSSSGINSLVVESNMGASGAAGAIAEFEVKEKEALGLGAAGAPVGGSPAVDSAAGPNVAASGGMAGQGMTASSGGGSATNAAAGDGGIAPASGAAVGVVGGAATTTTAATGAATMATATGAAAAAAVPAGVRARLHSAKDAVPFLHDEDSRVREFWTIWAESIPDATELSPGTSIDYAVSISANVQKLQWRTSGPQMRFIQRMVDFFWTVGAPETEIDKLNEVGALVNPVLIGSWIDMSSKGGMDGGWFFPVDVPIDRALEASDAGGAVTTVATFARANNLGTVYSIGRDMGAAPPRQTEIRLRLNQTGLDPAGQLDLALQAYSAFDFPQPPPAAVDAVRQFAPKDICLSIVTSSEGFVRIGMLLPAPPPDAVAALCQIGGGIRSELALFEASLGSPTPIYAELQYLQKGCGYMVYREGFDVIFHYSIGSEQP